MLQLHYISGAPHIAYPSEPKGRNHACNWHARCLVGQRLWELGHSSVWTVFRRWSGVVLVGVAKASVTQVVPLPTEANLLSGYATTASASWEWDRNFYVPHLSFCTQFMLLLLMSGVACLGYCF